MVMVALAPRSASSINLSRSSRDTRIGSTPFWKQLLKKMSAKLVEMTQRTPKSSSAQGACSREEPQPKLSSATMIFASR